VTGVRTAAGELLDIDAAVLATGSDVPRTVAQLGVGIPDATPIGLLVRTLPIGTRLRAVLNAPRVYVRPTPSGARVLEGLVRAGGRPPGGRDLRGREVHGRRLLHEASAVLEGNPALTLESYGAGPKPVPGDGEPMLGALAEVPGYHVAFTHSGATLALIVGELLAEEIVTSEPSPLPPPSAPAASAEKVAPAEAAPRIRTRGTHSEGVRVMEERRPRIHRPSDSRPRSRGGRRCPKGTWTPRSASRPTCGSPQRRKARCARFRGHGRTPSVGRRRR
jgi:FAD dependent oxidoreductase